MIKNPPVNNNNFNWERYLAKKSSKTVSVNPQSFTEEEKAQAEKKAQEVLLKKIATFNIQNS